MAKIVPSERLRRELDQVLNGVAECDDPVEAVARAGARLIMQQALAEEVTEFLGRERYARGADGGAIYRNGYEPRTVKTTSGVMELERPRIRSVSELGFESQVLGKGVARTHALEALIILGFLRGLSVRDVEDLLEEALGEQVVGSRPSPGSARTPASVTGPGASATSRRTISSTATWTRSISSCAPTTSPPRASWSPGGSRSRARRSCSGCSSARARAMSRGWTSAATSSSAGCARRR